MNDLRFAFPQLLKNPGFTAVVVLTLALGIGANTAIFSVLNAVLLRPLPYPEPDRLVAVCESTRRLGWDRYVTSTGAYSDWRDQSSSFQELAGAIVLGRMKTGVSLAQAQAEMTSIAQQQAGRFPESNRGWGITVQPWKRIVVQEMRLPLLLLLGAVGLVLLIMTANITNLHLARAIVRQKEFAVRMALGAGRWRTVRQFLAEGMSLSFLGCIGGLILGQWSLHLLKGLIPENVPRIGEIHLDGRVLGFALVLMELFAGLALMLAVLGLCGVLACVIGERRHEIAIRLAVGARQQDIARMVMRHGMQAVLIGGLIGLVGACLLGRFLRSQLYEISPTDPLTLIVVTLLLLGVASLACWFPARRATRIDPMEALRHE